MEFNNAYIRTRSGLLKHIKGENLTVLDVGCATGQNGSYLLENKIAKKVVGVEYDEQMGLEAEKKLSKTIIGSIEDKQILDNLKEDQYDYIILGDVLEHLVDPWKVLTILAGYLNPNGKVILSIPNVQHIDVFYNVYIKGTWPLNKAGLFDRTHLRWFTKKDLMQLIKKANLRAENIERRFKFRDLSSKRFPIWAIPFRKAFPNLFTRQYVIVCGLEN